MEQAFLTQEEHTLTPATEPMEEERQDAELQTLQVDLPTSDQLENILNQDFSVPTQEVLNQTMNLSNDIMQMLTDGRYEPDFWDMLVSDPSLAQAFMDCHMTSEMLEMSENMFNESQDLTPTSSFNGEDPAVNEESSTASKKKGKTSSKTTAKKVPVKNRRPHLEPTEKQSANVERTIAILAPRLGFPILYSNDKQKQRLWGRIFKLEKGTTPFFPLNVRVQYPVEQETYWENLSAAGRQATHDFALLQKIEINKETAYLASKNGASAGPGRWLYQTQEGILRNLGDLLSVDVRTGKVSLTDVDPKILPPIREDYVVPDIEPSLLRKGPDRRPDAALPFHHLTVLLPDMEEAIMEFLSTDDGAEFCKNLYTVKPSERSLDPNSGPSTKEVKSMLNEREQQRRLLTIAPALDRSKQQQRSKRKIQEEEEEGDKSNKKRRERKSQDGTVINLVDEVSYDEATCLKKLTLYPPLLHSHVVSDSSQLEQRMCTSCNAPFQAKAQNAAMKGGDSSDLPPCDGYVCPKHPEHHSFCFGCLIGHIVRQCDAGFFPIYCPGSLKRKKCIDDHSSIIDTLRCDFVLPSEFLLYVHRNINLSDGHRTPDQQRILRDSYRKSMEVGSNDAHIDLCTRLNPYHYSARCPHLLQNSDPNIDSKPIVCNTPQLWDRRSQNVPIVTTCIFEPCSSLFCTGCLQPITDPSLRRHHEKNCRRWWHSTYDPIVNHPSRLAEIVPSEIISNKKQEASLRNVIAECLTLQHSRSDTSACPSCKRRINLIRYHEEQHPDSQIITTHITRCPCNVDWCYFCEKVLPRSQMQISLMNEYSLSHSLAPYSDSQSLPFDPCRHNDHGLQQALDQINGSTKPRTACPLLPSSLNSLSEDFPSDPKQAILHWHLTNSLNSLRPLLSALRRYKPRMTTVMALLPPPVLSHIEQLLKLLND